MPYKIQQQNVCNVTPSFTARKAPSLDDKSAAELLLSVSPVIKPKASPSSMKRSFDPLESLASLASMELPVHVHVKSGVVHHDGKLQSNGLHALIFDKREPPKTQKGKCPSNLSATYQNIYNKNGRIGIYTPTERQAILEKFRRKRERRVWKKKIRYGCRKSLADQRLRVKGRFVKQSTAIVAAKTDNGSEKTSVFGSIRSILTPPSTNFGHGEKHNKTPQTTTVLQAISSTR